MARKKISLAAQKVKRTFCKFRSQPGETRQEIGVGGRERPNVIGIVEIQNLAAFLLNLLVRGRTRIQRCVPGIVIIIAIITIIISCSRVTRHIVAKQQSKQEHHTCACSDWPDPGRSAPGTAPRSWCRRRSETPADSSSCTGPSPCPAPRRTWSPG